MTTAELERLRAIVGREYVQGEGLAREYAVEGRAPEAVAEPRSTVELDALIALAAEMDWPLVAWGGATQMSLGAPPSRYRLAITMRRMNRILDYQPEDMTVTVQSGIILANLARTLSEHGQFLPVDPPIPQRATAGGTVAAAASGPLRAAYGTPRDWLLGAGVVGADGQVVSAGGSVVKNVAGYDLCKLYTGSLGTLGILSRLTFKVLPKPRVWGYSGVSARDAASIEALIAGVQDSPIAPAALELVNAPVWEAVSGSTLPPDRLLAFFAFAGEEEAVAWQQSALEKLAAGADLRAYTLPELHAEVWFRAVRDFPARPGLLLRLAVRSSDTAALAVEVEDLAAGWGLAVDVAAHAANGVLWARLPEAPGERLPDIIAALRAAAAKRGGIAVVHRVPEGFAGHLERWGPPPAGIALMRGIKESLDPAGLLSPGRFVGGI